jgi:hypothetical protein
MATAGSRDGFRDDPRMTDHEYDDSPATCTTWSTCTATQTRSAAPGPVRSALDAKCAHAGIKVPAVESIQASPFRAEVEHEWVNSSVTPASCPTPVRLHHFWAAPEQVFSWLAGTPAPCRLASAWTPTSGPRSRSAPGDEAYRREQLRYTKANRLLVDIDYRAERGRQGVRRIGPHALRRSRGRQPAPVRRQRLRPAAQLPRRPHRRHPPHHSALQPTLPGWGRGGPGGGMGQRSTRLQASCGSLTPRMRAWPGPSVASMLASHRNTLMSWRASLMLWPAAAASTKLSISLA